VASEADQIRKAIEKDREELGKTVKALAHKADVKARAKEKVDDTKRKGQESAHQAVDKVAGAASPVLRHKRVSIPLLAGMAGAGGIFLVLRAKSRNHG
jgi:hypothetical protein